MEKPNLSKRILEMNFMKNATEKAFLPKEKGNLNHKWSIKIEEGIDAMIAKSPFARPDKLSKYIISNSRIKHKKPKPKPKPQLQPEQPTRQTEAIYVSNNKLDETNATTEF